MNKNYFKYNRAHGGGRDGIVTLLSVLIVGAVGSALIVSIVLLGVGALRTGFAYEESSVARAMADACAEEALQRIRDSESFAGDGGLSFSRGICSYSVSNAGAEQRIIAAFGEIGTITRKVEITIDIINPQINIVSWMEVADF